MKYFRILFLVLLSQVACTHEKKLESIEFESNVYKFNSEIEYYLNATKDGGTWGLEYNLVNEHEKALNALDVDREEVSALDQDSLTRFLQKYEPLDAHSYILEKAELHEIILFNEAHYFSYHFHFFKSFLADLSKLGYRYLALEGLGKGESYSIKTIEELNNRYSTVNPTYAEMMREALKQGFEIFNYDEDSGGEREQKGAQNIAEFLDGKVGKTLVLCGYDHIKETETKTYWEYALAGRIKEIMNTDPLTINQTFFMERSERRFENPLYQHILPEVPQVYVDADRQSFKDPTEPSWYDIIIFHPRTKFNNGKADWFTDSKVEVELDISSINITFPTKVFAFSIDQKYEQSTPYDVCELGSVDEQAILYLPKGEYYVIFKGLKNSNKQVLSVD